MARWEQMSRQNRTLSLCMIVKNEEKQLENCLSSVVEYVDEIVVVDTGSEDGTVQVASKYTDKVYSFNWVNDFSAARNFSIQKATSDYILILDADEFLTEGQDLKRIIAGKAECFLFKIKNYLSNGGSYTHHAYRMFKKGTGLRYEGRLHEHLNIEKFPEVLTREVPVTIHHEGYKEGSLKEKDKKIRNFKIIEQESKENPNAYTFYNLGRAQFDLGYYDKAQQNFKKSYQMDNNKSYVPDLLNKMSLSLLELNRYEEGLKIISNALTLFPNQSQLWLTKGLLYLEAGYLNDAEITFNKCLNMVEYGFEITEGTGSFIPKLKLAELFNQKGEILKAFDMIVDVIKEFKHYVPALARYFEIVKIAGVPPEETVSTLKAIYPINNDNELNNLLIALYNIRDPLLMHYLEDYNVAVNPRINAVANLLTRNYELAYSLLNGMDIISEDNYNDVLTLSFICKDTTILEKLTKLSLNKKEKSNLFRLVERENVLQKDISDDLINILINISMVLVDIRELDDFEYIYEEFIMENSPQTRIKFAKGLFSRGYIEIGQTVLLGLLGTHKNNKEVYFLLGDCFARLRSYDEARNYYEKALKYEKSFTIYERLYSLYDLQGLEAKKKEILVEMGNKFPLSEWVKSKR